MSYRKITDVGGLNHMETDLGPVSDNTKIFLQKDGMYINLGTLGEARSRAESYVGIVDTNPLIGVNDDILGFFGTPEIDDNLYISTATGGRARRSRKYRVRKSRRSRKYRTKRVRHFKKR